MALKAGLVGLPNVGKSTLFNALTKSSIPAENYPFCTVDPHVAITNVPDRRLEKLTKIFQSEKMIPATAQFVDIAGLVKGAAEGEGLGNQFLGHIMEVDLILHVLRCFEGGDVTHVNDVIDPLDDFETICAELMLKDLESINKREEKLTNTLKTAKNRGYSTHEIKELEGELELVKNVTKPLEAGDMDRVHKVVLEAKQEDVTTIPILSAKNYLIIANLSEDDFENKGYETNKHYQALLKKFGEEKVIPVSAKIEAELAQLDEEESRELMQAMGIEQSGLDEIINKSYQNLNLIAFFTCGPKEAHAWSIVQGTNIRNAAGTIHSDLERGFICSEVYNCSDIFEFQSEHAVKTAGRLRTEGKEYIVQDGDIIHVRFNV
ncbi:redox-regulated ATPase YchF [Candidatus Babeliales bacterium]|nr:redox-regulated ATPase YchF [Candidatus Babeliales bacterium]